MNTRSRIGTPAWRASPVALAVAAALGLSGPAVHAADTTSSELQEIVVTAQYRAENLQTTPLAITALTVEDLDERNLKNVDDLGLSIPNAYFRQPVSNFGPTNTIGLRGLIQGDFNYAFEPAVGVYIDDVYHGSLTGSSMDLTDLERVEVLRGPQGTLFGINSLGGAIRLISKKPTGSDTGSAEVTYGERHRIDVRAMMDLSLIPDQLFARVSAVSRRQDGYGAHLDFVCAMALKGTPALSGTLPETIDPKQGNGCVAGGLGGSESEGARVALRYLPSSDLEFNVVGEYSVQVAEPPVQAFLTHRGGGGPGDGDSGVRGYDTTVIIPKYGVSYTADNRFLTGNPYTNYSSYGNIVSGIAYDPNSHLHSWGESATADYSFTPKTHLKVIAAYRSYESSWDNDSDGTPFELIQTNNIQQHRQFQAETQLTGTAFSDKLDWTWGNFYYKSHSRAYNTANFVTFGLKFVSDDLFTTENKSTFLHGNYKLTDKLSVTAGLRYSDEAKTNLLRHLPFVSAPLLDFGGNHLSYKAGLDYQATDNVFVYTSVSDGFTSAGVTPRVFTANQVQGLPGEEVTNYEVGAKVELFDKRLRINSAVFYLDYKKRLANVFATECNLPSSPTPGQPYFLAGGTCPAGTPAAGTNGTTWFAYLNQPGKIRGFESEITAFPIRDLAINASVGYNKFKGNAPKSDPVLYRDDSALLQPSWNASAGIQYVVSLPNTGKFTPRLDYYFQSYTTNGAINTVQRTPDDIVPGYGLYNLRLSYDPPNGSWQTSFTVANLFNKFYWQQLGSATQANGAPAIGRVGTPSRPREWGITFKKNFQGL